VRSLADSSHLLILESLPDATYLIDPESSRIIWCNSVGYEGLGYSRSEIVGHSVLSLQKDVPGHTAWKDIAAEIRRCDTYLFSGRHIHKQGHEVSVEVLTKPTWIEGTEFFLSVARDISRRLSTAAMQITRDEQVRFALSEAGDGLWDWSVLTGEVYFSPQLKRMLGYGPDEMQPGIDSWSSRVHPDDAPMVFRAIEQHLQGMRERYEAEYRLRNRNGHYIWVHDRGRICESGPDGSPTRMVGMVRNITDQKNLEFQLLRDASIDSLTGLRNRRECDQHFMQLVETCKRLGVELGVCIIDIDHFKRINDVHGHLVGDRVLASVASLLLNRVRQSDSLFRWGGEEFVLLCPGQHLEGLCTLAQDLREMLATHSWADVPGLGQITASFGLTIMPVEGASPENLFLAADTALFTAKAQGRNCVVFTAVADVVCSTNLQVPQPPSEITVRSAF